MNYYERHLGDYARDTAHLSMLEHGAYTLLLDRYYATENGIPAAQAMRIARARTDDERAAVAVVLDEFFELVDGVWMHGRVEGEIEKAAGRINAARQNGRRGGRPRKNPDETQKEPDGFSLGSISETQTKALHTPDSIHHQGNETLSLSPADAGQGEGRSLTGTLEGHDQRPTSPEVRARLDLLVKARSLGCADGLTAKDLDPYIAAGGTPEHFATVAGWSKCAGKPGSYVLRAACSNLAENPPQVAAGTNLATIGGQPQRLGKTASAIIDMETEIRGLAQG